MSIKILEFVLEAVLFSMIVMTPFVMVWGWIGWASSEKKWTILSVASLAGFALATASTLLAIVSAAYANLIGGFAFYDQRLLRLFFWGGVLSLAGLVLGIAGIWRANTLRWQAPLCALGTLVFWVMAAESE
jgi:hypothetical protein